MFRCLGARGAAIQRKELGMKSKHHVILILLAILAMLAVSFGASAQDIDVDSMSNEQLMGLLQMIMQKLHDDETAKPAETPEVPEIPEEQAAEAVTETKPEDTAEPESYQIYENKKMLREKLPDSYFVKPEKHSDDDKPDKNKKKHDDHNCPPGTSWGCTIYGVCFCGHG